MEKVVLGPGIVAYKNVLPNSDRVINDLETSLSDPENPFKWNVAKVGEFETALDHRDASDFIFNRGDLGLKGEHNELLLDLYDDTKTALDQCLQDYCNTYKVGIEWIGAFNYVKYGPGGKFNHHSDDGAPYRCTVSAVGYFNDDYTGGALNFEFFGLTVKPDAGDLIIFPSSYIYSHASIPVESGTKYAVVIMTDRNENAHYNDSPIYKVSQSN